MHRRTMLKRAGATAVTLAAWSLGAVPTLAASSAPKASPAKPLTQPPVAPADASADASADAKADLPETAAPADLSDAETDLPEAAAVAADPESAETTQEKPGKKGHKKHQK